jgi:hypothetical protein
MTNMTRETVVALPNLEIAPRPFHYYNFKESKFKAGRSFFKKIYTLTIYTTVQMFGVT